MGRNDPDIHTDCAKLTSVFLPSSVESRDGFFYMMLYAGADSQLTDGMG